MSCMGYMGYNILYIIIKVNSTFLSFLFLIISNIWCEKPPNYLKLAMNDLFHHKYPRIRIVKKG